MPTSSPAPLRASDLAQRPFLIIAWLVAALALLKGMRMPGLWGATHLVFNYSHGFIRRGLMGQLVRMVGDPWIYRYGYFAIGSFLLLILVGATLAYVVRAALRTDDGDLGLRAAVLVFLAAPGLVTFIHVIGYLDYVGLLLLLFFVLLAPRVKRRSSMFAAGLGLGVALALIHEVMVVMFAPVALVVMLCRIAADELAPPAGAARPARPLLSMAAAGAVTALTFVASVIVGTVGTKDVDSILALQSAMVPKLRFPMRADAFRALYRTTGTNITTLMPEFWSNPDNQRYLVTGLAVTFPAVAFLAYYGVRLIRRLGAEGLAVRTQRILIAVFLGAVLAPLSLNFVGWDSTRWNAACLLEAFTGVLCLKLFFTARSAQPARQRIDDPVALTLAGVATVIGLCSTGYRGFLFDGYTVQWFPFVEQLSSAVELVRSGFRFMPHM